MKKVLSLCIAVILLAFFAHPAFSQTTDEILAKMIKAQGGKKALAAVKDVTFSGSMEMIQMAMTGTATMYMKEPNMIRYDMEIMGMEITQAFDGEMAWWVNPQTGSAEEMPEEMSEDFKRGAYGFSALLNPGKYGIKYEYKGKEEIDGTNYHVLEQTFPDGNITTNYLDPKTFLIYKTKTIAPNQMGVDAEVEQFLSDYKEDNGIISPHTITIVNDGEEFMVITVDEVTFNSGLEDSFFKMEE